MPTPERLKHVKDYFLYSLYKNICISLFEKDKLLFSFTMCIKLIEFMGNLNEVEYKFFLTGGISVGGEIGEKPAEWIVDKTWREINKLSKLKAFNGFVEEFIENIDKY